MEMGTKMGPGPALWKRLVAGNLISPLRPAKGHSAKPREEEVVLIESPNHDERVDDSDGGQLDRSR